MQPSTATHFICKPLCPLVACVLVLTACGGGGGGGAGTGGGGSPSTPSSGPYTWLLKAQGPTDALQYGLSLLHPSQPTVEYVVEFGSSVVTDARLVQSASIDTGALKASSLSPHALLYIVGGDVRRVPMIANGSSPATLVQRAKSTSACKFIVDGNDYATPESSRYIVSTAGPDGQCGTSDDGAAEVRLGDGGISFTPMTGAMPLAMFRDAATLAPRGWVLADSALIWSPASGSSVTLRGNGRSPYTAAVASAYNAALMDDGTQLALLSFPAGSNPTETLLDAGLTGGGGWVGFGYDASSFYVYRNTGSVWVVASVRRAPAAVTLLASGAGQVGVASMGSGLLYVNIVAGSGNSLLAISKTPGVPVQTLESTSSSTLTSVQTSANGVHQRWRVSNIGTQSVNYTVEMFDELGNTLFATNAGGFPMAVAEPAALNFTVSENRGLFLFATGFGNRAFGDAALVGYDTQARAATTFGTLPGSAQYGTSTVYALAMGGPGSFMGAYAAASSGGTVLSTGSTVMSFSAGAAGSLIATTTAQ